LTVSYAFQVMLRSPESAHNQLRLLYAFQVMKTKRKAGSAGGSADVPVAAPVPVDGSLGVVAASVPAVMMGPGDGGQAKPLVGRGSVGRFSS
jgi:hypothetical protein